MMDQKETRNSTKKLHIGVIGAGVSGLRAADILLRHGFQVTILEARNRLGGRVHQERLPNGHFIDIGANWIHGANDSPIMDLARETKTEVSSWDTVSYVFNEDGDFLSLDESTDYFTTAWTIIGDAFEYSSKHTSGIAPEKSLLDFFRDNIKKAIPDTERDYEKKRHMVLQLSAIWGAIIGSPVNKQSLKFFWLEESIEGENLFCASTYRKILEKIAQPAVDGADIRYATQVSQIHGKSSSTAAEKTVKVKTTDGQVFDFDEIVLTTPLGWLQKNLQSFQPPLPERLSKGIQSIGYGCLEKVYISFPAAFWLTPDANSRTIEGFCQWLSPTYALDTNPARWSNEAVELGSLTPSTAHPTLLFYIHGPESQHVTSTLRSLPTQDAKNDFVFAFFEPYYARLPSFDPESCRPTGFFATDWLGDDLAGNGSYSNFQVGLEEGDEDIRTMREGAPEQGIWMAGEHTAPFDALGTVAGAYRSGELVAKRVADVYGMVEEVRE
ncbi:hypothetical protein B0T22DRAFT_473404 [Podospora appendiculata]|uniref:Amine oxidase domain-containing protein n=1 Tax=Podospora appendiculata TaxID=314037 RepID=A0AAE1C7H1_9PEZI|nr:hypothetical protein B0T22DRAFT_473404 [Podospora appendiculata]